MPKKAKFLKTKYFQPWAVVLVGLLSLIWTQQRPQGPASFVEAKRIAQVIFQDHPYTFYCNCYFDSQGRVDWQSCGYQPGKHRARAAQIEVEHLMPAHAFGKYLPCWYQKDCKTKTGILVKGRKCCQAIDRRFNIMEGELYNLVPAIGEINYVRSNYGFAELPHVTKQLFGHCYFKVDFQAKLVEPHPRLKGWIARSYLYMSQKYAIPLSDKEKQRFVHWHQTYPPSAIELRWAQKIHEKTGEKNTFYPD